MENLTEYLYTPDNSNIKPDLNEIYRYMGIKDNVSCDISKLTEECIEIALKELKYTACYMFLPIKICEDKVDFELFSVNSKSLKKELTGFKKCVVFAATIGAGIDRLIARYSAVSPIKALIYQAIGTEMIEKFCDNLSEMISSEFSCYLSNRFSPGYADFDLQYQRKLSEILSIEKKCAITLTESLIMKPSKSVTAISGIGESKPCDDIKCNLCAKIDCMYRKCK